ncbi:hypothetical protein F8O06_12020 [Pseudoclavibacter sp. CFCC 14310]|nr:hypothetical protein F8O06_12020 [Pseudoclavibacter sp. CFCC 14310]
MPSLPDEWSSPPVAWSSPPVAWSSPPVAWSSPPVAWPSPPVAFCDAGATEVSATVSACATPPNPISAPKASAIAAVKPAVRRENELNAVNVHPPV